METDTLTSLLRFWKNSSESTSQPEALSEEAIQFKAGLDIKPVSRVSVRVGEFSNFLCHAVKYGNREVTAAGTGVYDEETKAVKVTSIYPIFDASGSGASVTITARNHERLQRALDYWKEDDEVAIFHSHPHFSSFKSETDDQRAIRMACLLFGGVVAMIIVDPFSDMGVDISAYALDPETKIVHEIPFQLVS